MATTSPSQPDLTAHDLLLRLAGRIPDPVLAQARRMLAAGKNGEAIALVADLLATTPILLTGAELAAIRDLAGDAGTLPAADAAAEPLALQFGFGELDKYGDARRDDIDDALVAAAEEHSASLAGIWRTWRYFVRDEPAAADQVPPAGDHGMNGRPDRVVGQTLAVTPVDGPLRVYVAQVEEPAMIQEVAACLLGGLPDTAEIGLEVITLGAEPPPYQRAALARSLLLWAIVTEPEFMVARVFDYADPVTGPGFAAGHPVIGDLVRREQLLAYLRSGNPVLMTGALMEDVLDPAAGAVVPASFRTDGEWIWTDSVEYYLSRHFLAPDADLTAHIETQIARGERTPDTDEETVVRAGNFLLDPPAGQATTAV